MAYRHGKANPPRIGEYDVSNAQQHYRICSRPVDTDARLGDLLLMMLLRVDVTVEEHSAESSP